MVKLDELTETGPGPESVPVALKVCAPEVSMRRLVKVAMPATAALTAVPGSAPPPVLIAAGTLVVGAAPGGAGGVGGAAGVGNGGGSGDAAAGREKGGTGA